MTTLAIKSNIMRKPSANLLFILSALLLLMGIQGVFNFFNNPDIHSAADNTVYQIGYAAGKAVRAPDRNIIIISLVPARQECS